MAPALLPTAGSPSQRSAPLTADHSTNPKLCECGCGRQAGQNQRGQLNRFIHGHQGRLKPSRVEDGKVELFGKWGKGRHALVDPEDEALVGAYRWYVGKNGYVISYPHKRGYLLLHRLLAVPRESESVDHRNRNKLDCRKDNLRIASPRQNAWNSIGQSDSGSKYKGVAFHKRAGKWEAYIQAHGKKRHLGLFANEEDAAHAYDCAAEEVQGEFFRPNQ